MSIVPKNELHDPNATHGHAKGGLAGLAMGAVGVVFGDIGTSPLYTMKEAFIEHYGLVANHDTVLGVLSLAFWSLMIVVTLKYVTVIMNADNEGEGGIMALMALAQRTLPKTSRSAYAVGILGIFGASLFFGDGVITPAITTLSAVEGLGVAAPALKHWVVRGAQSLWEHRKGHSRHYAADITWHLQLQADGWRISQKVIRLVNSDDVLHSIGYIL